MTGSGLFFLLQNGTNIYSGMDREFHIGDRGYVDVAIDSELVRIPTEKGQEFDRQFQIACGIVWK